MEVAYFLSIKSIWYYFEYITPFFIFIIKKSYIFHSIDKNERNGDWKQIENLHFLLYKKSTKSKCEVNSVKEKFTIYFVSLERIPPK